jgi:hypothetical protein
VRPCGRDHLSRWSRGERDAQVERRQEAVERGAGEVAPACQVLAEIGLADSGQAGQTALAQAVALAAARQFSCDGLAKGGY